MFPVEKDLHIYQGTDYCFKILIPSVNIANIDLKSFVKRKRSDIEIVFEFKFNKLKDAIIVTLDSDITNKLKLENDIETFVYDIKANIDGGIYYIQQGNAFIYKAVTK